jgi:hypothetical protein
MPHQLQSRARRESAIHKSPGLETRQSRLRPVQREDAQDQPCVIDHFGADERGRDDLSDGLDAEVISSDQQVEHGEQRGAERVCDPATPVGFQDVCWWCLVG